MIINESISKIYYQPPLTPSSSRLSLFIRTQAETDIHVRRQLVGAILELLNVQGCELFHIILVLLQELGEPFLELLVLVFLLSAEMLHLVEKLPLQVSLRQLQFLHLFSAFQ